MNDDDLTILDVEHGILTGKIVERQRDSETGDCKYVTDGRTVAGGGICVVARLSPFGKLVIVTVYRA